ncbi:hypothetical protein NDU88_001753 [Pleurodeles waltl]|uniref:Uncharacterized protein n=1 Tax=Pleurodeles waltl TaxID=8319 RepID=A0AAV7U7B7_PLEWA|nr:hypothetical protein NDU88_001753 [Pleurodeles waltl]
MCEQALAAVSTDLEDAEPPRQVGSAPQVKGGEDAGRLNICARSPRSLYNRKQSRMVPRYEKGVLGGTKERPPGSSLWMLILPVRCTLCLVASETDRVSAIMRILRGNWSVRPTGEVDMAPKSVRTGGEKVEKGDNTTIEGRSTRVVCQMRAKDGSCDCPAGKRSATGPIKSLSKTGGGS